MTSMMIKIVIESVHATIELVEKYSHHIETKIKKRILRMAIYALLFGLVFGLSKLDISVYFLSLVLLLGYPIFLHFLYKSLETIKEEKLAIIIMLFLIVSINMIIFYGAIAYFYSLLETDPITKVTFFDSIYWASTTFTTLGYGDYLPKEEAGKFVSIALSLTGTMHMVSFLAILLNKLNK